MGRKKITIECINDQRQRRVTYFRRRHGLLKKAEELAVLCDCNLALVILPNPSKRPFTTANKGNAPEFWGTVGRDVAISWMCREQCVLLNEKTIVDCLKDPRGRKKKHLNQDEKAVDDDDTESEEAMTDCEEEIKKGKQDDDVNDDDDDNDRNVDLLNMNLKTKKLFSSSLQQLADYCCNQGQPNISLNHQKSTQNQAQQRDSEADDEENFGNFISKDEIPSSVYFTNNADDVFLMPPVLKRSASFDNFLAMIPPRNYFQDDDFGTKKSINHTNRYFHQQVLLSGISIAELVGSVIYTPALDDDDDFEHKIPHESPW